MKTHPVAYCCRLSVGCWHIFADPDNKHDGGSLRTLMRLRSVFHPFAWSAAFSKNCQGCPLRWGCYKKRKGNREIEVNHRLMEYKRKARERLTSERGLEHRSNRPIEPEAVFGQMKYNMHYKRFRHFGKDKVTMDFAFFAIAFNIKKMAAKVLKQGNMPTNGRQYMHPATSYMRVLGLVWPHKAENMKKAA